MRAQLQRHLELLPRCWPMAAITRELDAGDAACTRWLRADPAHVQADLDTARMLACGNLGLSREEADALLKPLRPLFGDAGFPISAPVPERWYLELPREAKVPEFAEPECVLGDDLYDHLPPGPEGRRWRVLLNEAQVILHHHPLNEARAAAGKPAVNSIWFWGAGILPDAVSLAAVEVCTAAADLAALAKLAGVRLSRPSDFGTLAAADGPVLVDLRERSAVAELDRGWLRPALAALARGRLGELRLDFADGAGFRLRRSQRWRRWRPPLRGWDA